MVGQAAEEAAAFGRLGLVAAGREIEIRAGGERDSTNALGLRADMNADIRKTGVQRLLHLNTQRFGQSDARSGRAQHARIDDKVGAAALPLDHRRCERLDGATATGKKDLG